MDLSEIINPGMSREETFQVEEQHAARHVGSGDARVLATPWMIAFLERVSHRLVAAHLPESHTSVGVHVDVRHLTPAPVGCSVRVRVEVESVYKNRVNLSVIVQDDEEVVGEGTHQRAVVEQQLFLQRVEAKK